MSAVWPLAGPQDGVGWGVPGRQDKDVLPSDKGLGAKPRPMGYPRTSWVKAPGRAEGCHSCSQCPAPRVTFGRHSMRAGSARARLPKGGTPSALSRAGGQSWEETVRSAPPLTGVTLATPGPADSRATQPKSHTSHIGRFQCSSSHIK